MKPIYRVMRSSYLNIYVNMSFWENQPNFIMLLSKLCRQATFSGVAPLYEEMLSDESGLEPRS